MAQTGRKAELPGLIPGLAKIEKQSSLQVKNLDIVKSSIGDIKIAVTVKGNPTRTREKTGGIAEFTHDTMRQPIRTEKLNPEVHGIENCDMSLVTDRNGNGSEEKTVRCFVTAQRSNKSTLRRENKNLPPDDVGHIEITDRVDSQTGWPAKRRWRRDLTDKRPVGPQNKNLLELGICEIKTVAFSIQCQPDRRRQGDAFDLSDHRRTLPGQIENMNEARAGIRNPHSAVAVGGHANRIDQRLRSVVFTEKKL